MTPQKYTLSQPPRTLEIHSAAGWALRLHPDGRLEVNPTATCEAAAIAFVEALRPQLMALYREARDG